MKNKIIGKCPVCSENLIVTELTCNCCNTKISGKFTLSKFDYLTPSQQQFALIFLKNAGNIKMVEKDLNISYPTVKKNMEDVIAALGFEKSNVVISEKRTKEEIYKALKNGEIDFDEAEKILEEL